RPAPRRPLAGGDQHRLRALRRLERGQPGRCRGRALPLAGPALLGGADVAAARCRLAPPRRGLVITPASTSTLCPAANRRMPASSVGPVPLGTRPPCVLGLLGFRAAIGHRTYRSNH